MKRGLVYVVFYCLLSLWLIANNFIVYLEIDGGQYDEELNYIQAYGLAMTLIGGFGMFAARVSEPYVFNNIKMDI